MVTIMRKFKDWCGLFIVHGTIDGIHSVIMKPYGPFVDDYYYYKSGGYIMVLQ
jgi:hypothetical protein